MDDKSQSLLEAWHHIVFDQDFLALGDLLAEDIEFHSPYVWKPYHGRMAAFVILTTVADVFADFAYHHELLQGSCWALEFSARVGSRSVKGIDLITWNEAGQISKFEVFIRPFNGLEALGQEMQRQLAAKGFV